MTPEALELGIAPSSERKTVRACLRRGWRSINLPVMLLLAAGYGIPLLIVMLSGGGRNATNSFPQTDPGPAMGLLMFVPLFFLFIVLPISPAWLWWSYATPKWRRWALRNVDSWPALERAAIAEKLIWPRGSVFNLTEIKTSAQKALEQKLIAFRDEHG